MPVPALRSVICGHLVVAKLDLVEVDSESSVAEAVDLMQRHHIQSVPVYDKHKSGYIGTVSMFDVVMFAVKKDVSQAGAQTFIEGITVRNLIGIYKELKTGKRGGGLLGVQAASPLSNVMRPLSEGIPRILVALGFVKSDPTKPLFRLLSATDVVSHLTGRLEEFQDIVGRPIEACMSSDFVVRPLSWNTREALESIFEQSADAIAVTDDEGVLATTLSVSDCRDMAALGQMDLSVEEFLKARNFGALREPVSVRLSDDLATAMRKVVAARIHRVWVVDGALKPVGVVRLQDMLRQFMESS